MRVSQARYWGGLALLLACAAVGGIWLGNRPRVDYQSVQVQRSDVEATVTAIGSVQPRTYVDVGAQVSGQITRLHVRPGVQVEKGNLLAEIDPSVQQATVDAGRAALASLKAQIAEQQAQHKLAHQQWVRQQQLDAEGATKQEDVQTAEALVAGAAARIEHLRALMQQTQASLKADEARLGYTRIYAPMSGTVVSVDARVGQTLNATYQTPSILRIADLNAMTVWAEVSEADVRRVKSEMPVYFTTLGSAGQTQARRWSSRVRQVLPAPPASMVAANPSAAGPAIATKAITYTALFDVDNQDAELMPYMTAQVVFVTAKAEQALTLPLAALLIEQGLEKVRVLTPSGEPELRTVKLGVRSRHAVQVLEGVREGEHVVTGETPRATGWRWLQW